MLSLFLCYPLSVEIPRINRFNERIIKLVLTLDDVDDDVNGGDVNDDQGGEMKPWPIDRHRIVESVHHKG